MKTYKSFNAVETGATVQWGHNQTLPEPKHAKFSLENPWSFFRKAKYGPTGKVISPDEAGERQIIRHWRCWGTMRVPSVGCFLRYFKQRVLGCLNLRVPKTKAVLEKMNIRYDIWTSISLKEQIYSTIYITRHHNISLYMTIHHYSPCIFNI